MELELLTDRLLLRPLRVEDIDLAMENVLVDAFECWIHSQVENRHDCVLGAIGSKARSDLRAVDPVLLVRLARSVPGETGVDAAVLTNNRRFASGAARCAIIGEASH